MDLMLFMMFVRDDVIICLSSDNHKNMTISDINSYLYQHSLFGSILHVFQILSLMRASVSTMGR